MIDRFVAIYRRLLKDSQQYKHHRYIYPNFNIDHRLTGLIGPRGTGKTTILLQYINEKINNKEDCIYVSIDNIYFSNHLLTDFIYQLYEDYGIRYFFLDEVHKYQNWNQELKNIYDSFPDIKIIFSGSSSIDLIQGSHDLSRRGVIYRIAGLSFREYLLFHNIAEIDAVSIDDLLTNRGEIEEATATIKRLNGHFKKYLNYGYYPFHLEGENVYYQKIIRVIEKTIYEDIANYYRLKTENLANFKRIVSYMATIPPGELNRNNIAKKIQLDNKTIQNYLNILQETGLIELIAENKSGSQLLKQKEKIYLDNPDLYNAISSETGHSSEIGTIREIFFIKMLRNSNNKLFYSRTGDFTAHEVNFEIGGKNKSKKQIKHSVNKAFLVKDDILYGNKNEIPLYLFGFLY